jgi:hypothetical protein
MVRVVFWVPAQVLVAQVPAWLAAMLARTV